MGTIDFRRVASMPGSPVADTVYLVANGAGAFTMNVTDNDSPVNTRTLAASGNVLMAADRTALAALTSGYALLTEEGREGFFYATQDDISARVTLDTRQGVYVPFASDPTGASGGWIRDWGSHGWVPVTAFGVTPNGASGAGLEAAFAVTGQLQIPLLLNTPGETTGGGIGRYDSDRALKFYTNHVVRGHNNVRIRFTNDTGGLEPAATGTTITSNVHMEGFEIVGEADTSSSATATVGLKLLRCRDCYFDISIDKFVIARLDDAQDTGHISIATGPTGEYWQTGFPNPVNGYPDAGWRITGTSKKPQILTGSPPKIYSGAINSASATGTVPSNRRVTFALNSASPLYKQTGVKVHEVDANGYKPAITDYMVYAEVDKTDLGFADSGDFSAWTASAVTLTAASGASTVPGMDWTKIDPTATTANHQMTRNPGFSYVSGRTYSIGAVVKAAGETQFRMVLPTGAFGTAHVTFDTSNPAGITSTGMASAGYIALADSSYFVYGTAVATGSASGTHTFRLQTASYAGTPGNAMLVAHFQTCDSNDPDIIRATFGDYRSLDPDWINPGNPSVAAVTDPIEVVVGFGLSMAGADYFLLQNDPWGNVAVDLDNCSGIALDLNAIGGYSTGIRLDAAADNDIKVRYAQLLDTFVEETASCPGNNTVVWLESNNTTATRYDRSGSGRLKVDPHQGETVLAAIPAQALLGDAYTEVNSGNSRVTVDGSHPTRVLVKACLQAALSAPSNTTGAMYFQIVAYDNGNTSPRTLITATEVVEDATSEASVTIMAYDTTVLDIVGGIADSTQYAVQAKTSRAGDTLNLAAGSLLTAQRVPAYPAG